MCVGSGVTCVWYAVVLTAMGLKKEGYKVRRLLQGTAEGYCRDRDCKVQGTGIRQGLQDYKRGLLQDYSATRDYKKLLQSARNNYTRDSHVLQWSDTLPAS